MVTNEAPKYLTNLHENLEFVLERMRMEEGPVGLQLLNRNARRPKKVRVLQIAILESGFS